MFPVIGTDKFQLREMTINDVDDLFCYYSNSEMMKYTSTDVHISKDETLARITKLSNSFKNRKGIAWVVEETLSKRVIGDMGYGTQALTLALKYAITKMSINRIEATCKIDNIASARVMEKSGMYYEGTLRQYSSKNGEYYDVKMYSMIKNDIEH